MRERATSIYSQMGQQVDRLRVVESLLSGLESLCAGGEEEDGGQGEHWIARWKRRCQMIGRIICVRSGGRVLEGHVLDVDPLQGLVLRDGRGSTHFLSAQTSTIGGV